jgi:hypothetical protein
MGINAIISTISCYNAVGALCASSSLGQKYPLGMKVKEEIGRDRG